MPIEVAANPQAVRAVLQELRQLERETSEQLLLRRVDALDRVQEAVQRLDEIGSPVGVLDRAAVELGVASRFDRVLVSQVHEGTMTPHAVWLRDPESESDDLPERLRDTAIELDYPLIEAEMITRPETRVVDISRTGPRTPKPLLKLMRWDSYVIAALTLRGTTIGLIHADAPLRPEPIEDLDRELAGTYAEGLTRAFELAVLRASLDRHRSELHSAVDWMQDHLEQAQDTAWPSAKSPPEDGSAEGIEALTRREHEVLQLLTKGRTNSAIAASLLISESTVKFHVKNVLLKLGASSRADAAARYVRAGH